MEKSIVTFHNPETNKEITLTLEYNKEKSELNYDLKFSDNYDMKSAMDFNAFLAKMFIESLAQTEEDNKDE